jgi:hypothetical protein
VLARVIIRRAKVKWLRQAAGAFWQRRDEAYLVAPVRAVVMAANFVCRVVPTVVTDAMIATAMSVAIRPYSMAVTPRSSYTKRKIRVFIC